MVRPAPPVRLPPAPLARRILVSTTTSAQPTQRRTRRTWPKLAWLAVVILSLLILISGTFTFLLLTGQDEVIAWMVVGCVLVVVFGTPLLCVVGLVVFYFWALARIGRARTIPSRSKPAPASHQDDPVVWGEVVFDD